MMGMIAHHTGNLLEFDSSASHFARRGRIVSYDSSSSCDIPEMIMSASLKSFAESDDGDSLNESLSSSGRSQSPGMSPRSIFHSYWSSPNKALNDKNKDDDDDVCTNDNVLERLRTLKLPLSDDGRSDAGGDSHAPAATAVVVRPTSSRDDLVECQSSAKSLCGPSTRRQILPPPSPAPGGIAVVDDPAPRRSLPPSRLRPPPHLPIQFAHQASVVVHDRAHRGSWRGSARDAVPILPSQVEVLLLGPVLLLRSGPDGRGGVGGLVCPREAPPRTSQSGTCRPARVDDVVFDVVGHEQVRVVYSEVSVVEFAVPQEQQRSQEGWSRYFA
ncbi:hypothetical protein ACHAW5_008451 [Stephanodiscus triporus]|uniref:Uncharacterized protein n=1 Tax=Stephanodiscus triporus TaxID=2934178 RepID=A0ABD3MPU0_9STRA